MHKAQWEDQGGFTFVEILACIIITTILVVPICQGMLHATLVRITGERMEEATFAAGHLLEDLSERLEGVLGDKDLLLKEVFPELEESILDARYHLDRYAYEIALWPVESLYFVERTFTVTTETLKDALKIYSETNPMYQFDPSTYAVATSPITFTISEEMFLSFYDEAGRYVPNLTSKEKAYQVIDFNEITFLSEGMVIENKRQLLGAYPAVEVVLLPIKQVETGLIVGYEGVITEGTFPSELSSSGTYRSIIVVQNDTTERLPIKWNNQTPYHQLIYSAQTNQMVIAPTIEAAGPCSLIDDAYEVQASQRYLMVMVVRDKAPVLGEAGKQIKQMVHLIVR